VSASQLDQSFGGTPSHCVRGQVAVDELDGGLQITKLALHGVHGGGNVPVVHAPRGFDFGRRRNVFV